MFTAAFAAVLALCLIASEWLVRVHVAPIDTLAQHRRLVAEADAAHLAFGDSHVARGFNAQAPFVNLAYPSENIRQTVWKAARYLERAPAPEQVILQADPHLFAAYRLEAGLGDYPRRFGEAGAPLQALSDHHRPKIAAYWRAFALGGGALTSRIEPTPQGALLSPGDLTAFPPDERARMARERVALHEPSAHVGALPEARLYARLVAGLIGQGAELCLARFPVSPDYRAAVAAAPAAVQGRWEAGHAFFAELAERSGARYVDHGAIFEDAALFRDPDHLNTAGALRYEPALMKACFGLEPTADQLAAGPSVLPVRSP
ncbi:MAG: hypothetical protein MI723_19460 [Caulobacterales bacterium]|nr:hypothetical protein [Caulobacterales bacterium]